MASITSSTAATSQAPPLPQPAVKLSAPPVNVLPNQFARIYSLCHPIILLALVAIRFSAVIDDPVTELLNNLPILALLQVAFVMACLPPAGSSPKSSDSLSSPMVEEKKASGANPTSSPISASAGSNVILRPGKLGRRRTQPHNKNSTFFGMSAKLTPALLSLTLTFLLATPVLSILLVLFGAPLTTHHVLTVLSAAHMAVLSSTALIYVHGVDGTTWKEIWGAARPSDTVWGGALGTCLGAWFGAVPIPLDWDRPWQAYPITILTGAYLGHAVGMLLGRSAWLFGKRLDFTSEEDNGKKVD